MLIMYLHCENIHPGIVFSQWLNQFSSTWLVEMTISTNHTTEIWVSNFASSILPIVFSMYLLSVQTRHFVSTLLQSVGSINVYLNRNQLQPFGSVQQTNTDEDWHVHNLKFYCPSIWGVLVCHWKDPLWWIQVWQVRFPALEILLILCTYASKHKTLIQCCCNVNRKKQ